MVIIGLGSVAILGANQMGGWGAVSDKIDVALAEAGKDSATWWSFTGFGWGAVIAMFFSATSDWVASVP